MASRKQKMVADTAEGVCRFTEKKNLQLVEHGVVSSRGTLSWNCNFDNDCPELFISRDNYPLEWKCTGKDDNWRQLFVSKILFLLQEKVGRVQQ